MCISVIIPSQNDLFHLKNCLKKIYEQDVLPSEIILIDSSTNNLISEYINKLRFSAKINITYKKIDKAYAGKSLNIGVSLVKNKYLCFLDTKTYPENNWISFCLDSIKKSKVDVIFGSTYFSANTKFQKLVKAISYGNSLHETTPGSFMETKFFKDKKLLFNETLRSGYDILWRNYIKKNYIFLNPPIKLIEYQSLPDNFLDLFKRYILYSYNSAKAEIQTSLKAAYFSFFLIFLSFLVSKWNLLISGWQNSIYYIPYISRIYLLIIALFFFIFSLINFYSSKKNFLSNSNFLSSALKIIIVISSIYGLYKTRDIYTANHINISNIDLVTNILLIFIIIFSLLFRGIIMPLRRGISLNFLFPINFLKISLIGLCLDLIRSPFYILGGLISIPKIFFSFKNNSNIKTKVIFFSKYGDLSASIRYRFSAFKDVLENNNFEVVHNSLFDEKFFNKKIFSNRINYFNLFLNYIIRLQNLMFYKKPFIAVIHIELLPYTSILAELILKIRGIKYIIDLDDAVYHRYFGQNKFMNYIVTKKFKFTVKNASSLYAGNEYHSNYFKNYNKKIKVLPTTLSTDYYKKNTSDKKFSKITIVWIGTPSTSIYLNIIKNVFKKLQNKYDIQVNLIGIGKHQFGEFNYKNIKWNEDTEISEISKSNIGIMPLYDNHWSRGKCGFKILQYMASSIPVVASPVGVNKSIIKDGVNGFLANNQNQWFSKLSNLIENKSLRKEIGENGFLSVKRNYEVNNYKNIFLEEIISIDSENKNNAE